MTDKFDDVDPSIDTVLRRHNRDLKLCRCGNGDLANLEVAEKDKRGFISKVKCKLCQFQSSTKCRRDAEPMRSKINELAQLNHGDHLAWHRCLGYWHHGIYVGVDEVEQLPKVVEFHIESCSSRLKISRNTLTDFTDLYRIEHDDCYTDEYTVKRAIKCLDDGSYNVITSNCEHFSEWCKTGRRASKQVTSVAKTLGRNLLVASMRSLGLIAATLSELIIDENIATEEVRKKLDHEEMILCGLFWIISLLVFIPYPAYREYIHKVWPRDKWNLMRFIVQEFLATTAPFALLVGLENLTIFQLPGGYKALLFVIIVVASLVANAIAVVIARWLELLFKGIHSICCCK